MIQAPDIKREQPEGFKRISEDRIHNSDQRLPMVMRPFTIRSLRRQKLQVGAFDNVEAIVPKLIPGVSARSSKSRLMVDTSREDHKRVAAVTANSESSREHSTSTRESRRVRNEKLESCRYQSLADTRTIRVMMNQVAAEIDSSTTFAHNPDPLDDANNCGGTKQSAAQAVPCPHDEEHEDPHCKVVDIRKRGYHGGIFSGLLLRYAEALESRPLVSKCITSAVIGGLGDVGAQGIAQVYGGRRIWHDHEVS